MLISLTCLIEPFHPGIRGIWDSVNYCLGTKSEMVWTFKWNSSAVLSLDTAYFSNNLSSADEIIKSEHLTKSLWKNFHTVLSVFEDVITPTLDEKCKIWVYWKNKTSALVRESKTVLHTGFYSVDSGFFVSGTWILDSNSIVSGILESMSLIPWIPIPQAKISGILESGLSQMGRIIKIK